MDERIHKQLTASLAVPSSRAKNPVAELCLMVTKDVIGVNCLVMLIRDIS
jgi:hypothetical protein